MMGHMHDLRVWTIAYAPAKTGNMKRMNECHRLNAEMWYNISEALWRRIFYFIAFYFLATKLMKNKFMNANTNWDSHDTLWRDTVAHL